MTQRRAAIVCAGSLSTCPRMVKAADALHAVGWDVRMISASNAAWAEPLDRQLHARRRWRWEPIAYTRAAAPVRWLKTSARGRLADMAARHLPGRRPYAVTVNAFSRVHGEIVSAILRERQDLIYGGTTGALAAVAEASRISGTPCGLDFEDFHCGEAHAEPGGVLHNELAEAVMIDSASHAAFVTAGSAAIADACRERFGIRAIPINNVFPLPVWRGGERAAGPLRLYWFSQTIGEGRGLEDLVRAVGLRRIPCELHLRGHPVATYVDALQRETAARAPSLRIVLHAPSDPDSMVDACRPFDVGISIEEGRIPNRLLCLSNKALTYPLAGLALVLTDTPGQRPLAADLHGHGLVYRPGDAEALGEGLTAWASAPHALQQARDAAWEAARARWHWEHPLERDVLLAAAEQAA